MRHLVIATSYSPRSRSAAMGRALCEALAATGDSTEMLSLPELGLPFCDGGVSSDTPSVRQLRSALAAADTVSLAAPVYNYDGGPGARNVIALGDKAWEGKAVGLVCAAGGAASYMAIMGLANSLMLGHRCLVVPRFVYATGKSFASGELEDPEIRVRLAEMARALRIVGPAAAELVALRR